MNDNNQIFLNEILKNVSTLETNEIVHFMHEMGKIVAQRKTTALNKRESELMKGIAQAIPEKLQNRYEMLSAKISNETITPVEQQELLDIVDKIEAKRAKKLNLMVELARLRGVSLKSLAQELHTNALVYA